MNRKTNKNISLAKQTEQMIRIIARAVSWLTALLMATIVVQVILRYVFHRSFVALEEFQWHLFSVIILVSLSYSFIKDSHIRLDILHSRFSNRTREKIEIAGIIILLWPMIAIFFSHSLPFVEESFRVGESSDAPMGLKYRWLIKSVIPIAFSLLFIGSVLRLKRAISYLANRNSSNG